MPKGSRTRNSILNLISGFGGQMLVTLLGFVTRTVLIRTLGTDYLGINGLFTNILSMLSLTNLGLATAINFKLYKPLAQRDDKRVRMLLKFYRQAYRAIGILIFSLGLCLIPFLHLLIKDYDRLEIIGINAVLIFLLHLLENVSSYLFFAYRTSVMNADQRRYVLDIVNYAAQILAAAAQIVVLLRWRDYIAYTAMTIVFGIFGNLVNAVIVQRCYPSFFIREPDSLSRAEILDMFKDCGALFIYKVNAVVVKATDNLVLSKFIGIAMVGLYSNYLLFYRTCLNLLEKLYSATKASMGNLFAVESVEKQYSFFRAINYLSAILYGTAAVGVATCANEVINVWIGADYVIAQPLPMLIGIELFFAGINVNLAQIRTTSGVFRQMWYRPVVGIVINLGVSIALVGPLGINGVVIGTIAAFVLANFLFDPVLIHKYTFHNYRPVSEYYRVQLVYFALIAAIFLADMWICAHVFTGHGWFSAIFHVAVVGASVPAAFIALFWRTDECRYLVNTAKRVFKKILSH